MTTGKFVRCLMLGSTGLATLLSLGAAARAAEIETVMVTAEKVEENANDVGMSINALSDTMLKNLQITDTAGLAKAVPGFNYTNSAYGLPIYTLRGVGFYETGFNASPAVSVYLDEVPLPYSAMTSGVSFDLQRVEVLKGPQGTLFGNNSTGGAINYIAAKPTDTFQSGADFAFTNFYETQAQGFISGPISDTVRARLAVSIDEGGAWQESFTRNETTGNTNLLKGRFLVDWDATPDLSFTLNLNGWMDKSDSQAQQALAVVSGVKAPPALVTALSQYPIPPTDAREADWDPGVEFGRNNSFFQASVRGVYDLGNHMTLTSITSFDRLNEHWLQDTDGMAVQSFYVDNGGYIETYTQELRLAGTTENGLRWMVGGNFEHDNIYEFGNPSSNISSFPFRHAVTSGRTNISIPAVFANADYALTDQISLQAGIRYTDTDINNVGCTLDSGDGQLAGVFKGIAAGKGVTVNIPAGGCATLDAVTFEPGYVVGHLDQDNVSWRAGINWQPTDTILLYANASRGYKAGDFAVAGATFSSSLDPVVQESVQAYEGGAKLGLFDGSMQVNAAGFHYIYYDKQFRGKIVDPTLGSLNKLLNIPKSQINGAELEVHWLPIDQLNLSVGVSYIASEILDNYTNYNVLGQLQNLGGEAFPLTPKWQVNADAQYNFPIADAWGGFVGLHVNHQGETNAALGNLPLFAIDAYTNLDLRTGVQTTDGHWLASLFITNLTDTYSWSFVNLSGPDAVTRLANHPRTFGIRLSYRS